MFCRNCGYNLRSLNCSSCPECGLAFNPTNPHTWLPQRPGSLTPVKLVGVFITLVLLVSWGVSYWEVSHDRKIDFDLGIPPASLTLGGRMLWAFAGALVWTLPAAGISVFMLMVHYAVIEPIASKRAGD